MGSTEVLSEERDGELFDHEAEASWGSLRVCDRGRSYLFEASVVVVELGLALGVTGWVLAEGVGAALDTL